MSETNVQNTSLALKPAEQPKAEIVKASGSDKTKVVFRSRSGMFQKRPKAPTSLEVQRATAAKLVAVSPEKPKSDFEEIIDAQTVLAKRSDAENIGTAGVKAAEFLTKAAGFSLAQPENEMQPLTVIFQMPDLPHPVVDADKPAPVPMKPSWADEKPYLDVEILSTEPPKP